MRAPRSTWCGALLLVLFATDLRADDSELARRSLLLRVQYIATDYRGAVSERGHVANATEYAENLATAHDAAAAYRRLRPGGPLLRPIDRLAAMVEQKAGPADVEQSAARIVPVLRQELGLPPAPLYFPDLASGAAAFAKHCASCHGPEGRGDGPAAAGLRPPPRTLADPAWADSQSPLQIFNTVSVGIAGTAMASFAEQIDSSTLWAVAFFVLTLRPRVAPADSVAARPWIGVTDLSLKSNRELAQWLTASGTASGMALARSDAARRSEPTPLSLPEAMSRLAEAATAAAAQARAGRSEDASDTVAAAYFDAVEPVEPALAQAAPPHLPLLELHVTELRDAIARHTDTEPALRGLLAEIQDVLRATDGGGAPQVVRP